MKRTIILTMALVALASCDKLNILNKAIEVVDHNLSFTLSADPIRSCDYGVLRMNLTVADTLAGFTMEYSIDGMSEYELSDADGNIVPSGSDLVVGDRKDIVFEYGLPRLAAGDHHINVVVRSGNNSVGRRLDFSVYTTPPEGISHDLKRSLVLGNSCRMTISLLPEESDWSIDSVTSDNACLEVTDSGDGAWTVTAKQAGAGSLTVASGDRSFKITCTVMWQPVLTLDFGYAKGYLSSILASADCPAGKSVGMDVHVVVEGKTQYYDELYNEAYEKYVITESTPVGLPMKWQCYYGTFNGYVNPDEMMYWVTSCYENDPGGWEQYGTLPYYFTAGELNIYPYADDAYAKPIQVTLSDALQKKIDSWKSYGWSIRIDRENL